MERVGVREIRQNLSVFLRRVRSGEAFTVTDHGVPVAVLAPVTRVADDPLADLVALGRPTATQTLLAEREADGR